MVIEKSIANLEQGGGKPVDEVRRMFGLDH